MKIGFYALYITEGGEMMNNGMIENYVEQIYSFALAKTFTREEADDLSQEILYTALREMHKLRDESRFEPWLWGLANNVTRAFRRKLGKQRAMFSYDAPLDIPFEQDFDFENEELFSRLREKIAMLSAIYRDCIILHYYDGLNVKQIADRLGIPEGTVTWRLSEGRKKLKKEYTSMETSALKPVKLYIDIFGGGNYNGAEIPFPSAYINDALSQNILYHCYEEPQTIESLSKLCGVPAYYIEERVLNLLNREAVIEPVKGKYQTDFIIWQDKHGKYCEENAASTIMPIMNKMIDALKALSADAMKLDFYKAARTETDLFYIFGIMAFSRMEHESDMPNPDIGISYDGHRFRYIASMESGRYFRKRVGCQTSGNGTYSHYAYRNIADIAFRDMMYARYIPVCEDILANGSTDRTEAAAKAIEAGYIKRKEDGSLFVTCPAFTAEQFKAFCSLYRKHIAPLADEYITLVKQYIKGYRKLFPAHLSEDADRMCHMLVRDFYSVIIEYGLKNGILARPADDFTTDVLVQSRELA